MERPKQFEKSPESEVWNAIDAFEQILCAMPGDRTALETLYDAYEHIGDRDKALKHLLQLASIVIEEGDTESVSWVYEGLTRLGAGNPDANQAVNDLETLMLNMGMPSPTEMSMTRKSGTQGVDVTAELALAWSLRQADHITEDEYSVIAQDLTENSTKHIEVPVSVQHVLYDRNFKCGERVLAFMSQDSGTPVIHLSMFELNRSHFNALGSEVAARRGAMVFDRMGDDYLVAILNPYDKNLRDHVDSILNHRTHYYLTSAQDYDSYLMRYRQPNPAGAY